MTTAAILMGIVLAVFLSYAVLAPLLMNLGRFITRKWLFCPVHDTFGQIRFNSFGAALTAGYGVPWLRVKACSLLHKGEKCGESCLKGQSF